MIVEGVHHLIYNAGQKMFCIFTLNMAIYLYVNYVEAIHLRDTLFFFILTYWKLYASITVFQLEMHILCLYMSIYSEHLIDSFDIFIFKLERENDNT